jgi:hypothetical protein
MIVEAFRSVDRKQSARIRCRDEQDESIEWFAEACVSNCVDLEAHIRWAERLEDQELAEFFRRAAARVHYSSVMRRPRELTSIAPR